MKANENSTPNIMHMILYLLMLLPIFLMFYALSPFLGILMFIGWIIGLVFRLLTKENRKLELEQIKQSISDVNIFHIIMFILIAFPFLYFTYGIVIISISGSE